MPLFLFESIPGPLGCVAPVDQSPSGAMRMNHVAFLAQQRKDLKSCFSAEGTWQLHVESLNMPRTLHTRLGFRVLAAADSFMS